MTESNNQEWRIVSLIPDLSSGRVASHFSKVLSDNIEAKVSVNRYTRRIDVEEEVCNAIGLSDKKALTIYGSGSYHHCTYGLCCLAKKNFNDFSYVHIDHHGDCGPGYSLNCGNFVKQILEDKIAADYLFIGGADRHASAFASEWIIGKVGVSVLEEFINRSKSNNIYLSIDLDVMSYSEVSTSVLYDRGIMSKEILLDTIRFIKSRKNIISADILGYTFSFSKSRRQKSMELYEDIAKAIIGEDEWESHLRK